jgi:hypothetical protein
MPVPNIFGSATSAIPLSQLDQNFATAITLGNTAVYLGNTTTSLGNVTLTNVTISSGNVTVSAGSNTSPSITTVGDTNTGIYFPAADTIGFTEGGVEAMRIDSSGNVGIGTVSPVAPLDVNGTIVTRASGGEGGQVSFNNPDNASAGLTVDVSSADTARIFQTRNNSLMQIGQLAGTGGIVTLHTAASERARITSSGELLVGTTSSYGGASRVCVTGPATANQQQISCHNPSTSGTRLFVAFGTEATYTERGWIQWNGSTMALTNASDSRLKENIVNAPSALTKIAAMQIRSFDFKEDGRHVDYGVVAQELNEVLPSAVFEGSDNEDGSINKPWSVGLEPIIPILVKAIQEQQAIITSLTDRITELEAK